MNIVIDGKECRAEHGEYILDVAKRNGIHIPALCHSEALPGQGNCRMCIVEIIDNSRRKIVTSCSYPITKEIEVVTCSEKIKKMRKTIMRLISARAPSSDLIKQLSEEYDLPPETKFKIDKEEKCILCGLCVRACGEVGAHAISTVNRGTIKKVSTPFEETPPECIGCGACAYVCPTGAIEIEEHQGKRTIWNKTFELLKCTGCGDYFMTQEQYEYIKNKKGIAIDGLLCDKCRKKSTGEKLKEALCNVVIKGK